MLMSDQDVLRVNGKIEIEPYSKILPLSAFVTKVSSII